MAPDETPAEVEAPAPRTGVGNAERAHPRSVAPKPTVSSRRGAGWRRRRRVVGGVGTATATRDVSRRSRIATALGLSEERLALATEAAGIGIWDWDIGADKLRWDARMYELYGVQAADFSGAYDAWQAGLHPDDRARGDAAIGAAIAGVKDFNIEFRVVWPSGEVRNIEAHALVQAGPDGSAVRMIGVNLDITERKRAVETIRVQSEQYEAMVATTSDGFWNLDSSGTYLSANDAYCQMVGYPRDELLGMNIGEVESNESAEETRRHMHTIVTSGFDRFEAKHRRKDGSTFDIEASVSYWAGPGHFICFARDITAHKLAEANLADSEARLRTVLETTVDGVVMVDATTNRIDFANRAFCTLLGYGPHEVTGLRMLDIHPDGTMPDIWGHPGQVVTSEPRMGSNLPIRKRDGSVVVTDISTSQMTLAGRVYVVGCIHDVSERLEANEKINRMARYDLVTGLPNRQLFVDALDDAIRRLRPATTLAVLYLDLDRFQDINDTLGHPVGDLLLREAADRLRASVRASDTVARFGGDEFAVILSDVALHDPAALSDESMPRLDAARTAPAGPSVAGVAVDILKILGAPYQINANEIHSSTSIGISVYGPDSLTAEALLSHADVALYQAKAEARGTYRFFNPEMDNDLRARVALGIELREAIASEQLRLVYQPQVAVATGEIVGLEALVRWQHPTRGVVGPAAFIPEAERSGLIIQLGRWVIGEALRQTREWLEAGICVPPIGVNVSSVQFKRPREFERELAASLADYGLAADMVELELTESVLMEASKEHNGVLLRLHEAGYRIAIDDFGTGYSSLDYLRRFPVDRIKIAQDFIADIGTGTGSDTIVRASLALARELDIEVVVEGVETAKQFSLVVDWGCQIIQGFYLFRPLTAGQASDLLRAQTKGSSRQTTVSPDRTHGAGPSPATPGT